VARWATWIERFEAGDYPMVCVRSGRPADELVPVEAERRATWPWLFSPLSLTFWVARWGVANDRLWGKLPFATGHVGGISATWDAREGIVMIKGVHPDFVAACQRDQSDLPPRR
jgi:hypothetical protein